MTRDGLLSNKITLHHRYYKKCKPYLPTTSDIMFWKVICSRFMNKKIKQFEDFRLYALFVYYVYYVLCINIVW